MRVELLVTGDEIVHGVVVDTNSAWLLERLVLAGAPAARVAAAGDDPAEIERILAERAAACDVLVVSGGLGPTSDDHTAACAARVAGAELVEDPDTLARIRSRWARRGKPAPPAVERQALIPRGAAVLANDAGTAPAFRLRLGAAECFFFAGVPLEFRHLCERHLLPWVTARSGRAVASRILRCIGVPESELDALLGALSRRHGVRLGLRAAYPETWALLSAEAADSAAAGARVDAAAAEAAALLGTRCFSDAGETLAEVTGRLCRERGVRLAVAESCTGGLLGGAITEVAGSSSYFLGGAVTYANEEKVRALGVEARLLEAHGAVSEPVVRAMAEGARTRAGATHALAITGVAGPGGGTADKPVGTVWIGLAAPAGTRAELHRFTREDRESIRTASVATALDLLRRELLEAR